MQRRWYGPGEPWPSHPKAWWNRALRKAKDEGWHLLKHSDHTWGKVVCSRTVEEPHITLIFSTGRSGEHAARGLERLVARCRHPRDDGEPADHTEARRLLDGVERLCAAAQHCLEADHKRVEAEELLAQCEDTLREVDHIIALS